MAVNSKIIRRRIKSIGNTKNHQGHGNDFGGEMRKAVANVWLPEVTRFGLANAS